MITAKDVQKLIDEHDPRMDAYIEEKLVPKFLKAGPRITLPAASVFHYFGSDYTIERFRQQLLKRGFTVKFESDDRPGGSSWYEIAIPITD